MGNLKGIRPADASAATQDCGFGGHRGAELAVPQSEEAGHGLGINAGLGLLRNACLSNHEQEIDHNIRAVTSGWADSSPG